MRQRISLVASFVFFTIVLGALWQRQAIYDWLRLRDYQPSKAVMQLAERTTMLPSAERLFYVYHPSLEGKETFNEHCSQSEQTIVLGCYISARGIYIYDITDERLSGIEEVTAAHEMLHAAYDRLGGSERSHINNLLQQAFANIDDARIKKTITNYQNNGADVNNELHSILGTEVRNLPEALEKYYQQYFENRSKIVDYLDQYERVFVKQQETIDQLARQIDQYESSLANERASIEAEAAALESEAQRLDNLRNQDRVNEYNAAVPAYNVRLTNLNARILNFNNTLDTYKKLIEQYNKIAQTVRELNSAIDSRINTPSNL